MRSLHNYATVICWVEQFKHCRQNLEGGNHLPIFATKGMVNKVNDIVTDGKLVYIFQRDIEPIQNTDGNSQEGAHFILYDVIMRKISFRRVSRLLTTNRRKTRHTLSRVILNLLDQTLFFFCRSFVTMGEIWVGTPFRPEAK